MRDGGTARLEGRVEETSILEESFEDQDREDLRRFVPLSFTFPQLVKAALNFIYYLFPLFTLLSRLPPNSASRSSNGSPLPRFFRLFCGLLIALSYLRAENIVA